MTHFEIGMVNRRACSSEDAAAVGSYVCNLHRWGARGIEHSYIQLGRQDPSELPVGALAPLLLQIAEARSKGFRKKEEVPFNRLIGMTTVRLCMHPYETPARRRDVELVGEYVESFAFVSDINRAYPAEYHDGNATVSPLGVSTKLRVHVSAAGRLVTAQHLLASPGLERNYPVTHATPSLAATFLHKNAWLALRAMPDETRFVETLVSRDELMDTFEPAP